MPLVALQYKRKSIRDKMLGKLARALPTIVAGALDIPENRNARLTPAEIEVWVMESGKHDVNVKDIEIIIWAHDYPERLANLEARKETILDGVRTFLAANNQSLSGFVWVLLQPSAYGEL
jgi:hypothetical protein